MSVDNLMLTFIDFFKNRGYKFLIKENVVNYSKINSELLFINSGIAGIIDMFTNEKIDKLVTVQTCLRIDGKHNDFENIGKSTSHFSSFKMLGTFSNNNTDVYSMIKDIYDFICCIIPFKNIYVTVHKDDEIIKDIWKRIDNTLSIFEDEENVWSMGDFGPRGYCTEIYYYDNKQDKDDKNGIEIWNIVMVNKNVMKDGSVVTFDSVKIDTGGGLERLYSVFDDQNDVYLIDDSRHIMNYLLNFFSLDNCKIIVDSVKLINTMLNSNVAISNNKHGYILKKVFRKLISVLVLNNAFAEANIIHIFSSKIKKMREFLYILKKEKISISKCEEILNKYLVQKSYNLNSEDIVKLHNTYGINFMNTISALEKKNNVKYDVEEIKSMIYSKYSNTKINNQYANLTSLKDIKQAKFIENKYEDFISGNYKIYNESINEVSNILKGEYFYMLLEETIFYPESGGQAYDTGYIYSNKKLIAEVNKVIKYNNLILHYCLAKEDISIEILKSATIKIDIYRREKLSFSHSAHHLLLSVIEDILCERVYQQSSNICLDKITVSFYSIRKLSDILNEEILSNIINNRIQEIDRIEFKYKNTEESIINNYKSIMTGYDTTSRVIEIYSRDNKIISKELCGGTHLIDKSKKIKIDKISEQNAYVTKISFRLMD